MFLIIKLRINWSELFPFVSLLVRKISCRWTSNEINGFLEVIHILIAILFLL